MNRRALLSSFGAVIAASAAPKPVPSVEERLASIREGDRLEGCLDLPNNVYDPIDMMRCLNGKFFVDGVEIKEVTYANTRAGVVFTFDVFRDGKPHITRSKPVRRPIIINVTSYGADGHDWRRVLKSLEDESPGIDRYAPSDFPGRDVECPIDGVLRERLTGKVELFAGPVEFAGWRKKITGRLIGNDTVAGHEVIAMEKSHV